MSAAFQLPELDAPAVSPLRRAAAPAPIQPPVDLAAERETARAEGHAEGHAAGYAQGLEEARAQMASAIAALEAAACRLADEREALCARVEPVAAELAIAGAEQVVGVAIELQPELLRHPIGTALRRLVERDQVTVLVHPDDLDTVRGFSGDLMDQLGGIEMLEVQSERRVAAGGAIVATPTGDIDVRLETRLDQLALTVRDALAR